ncbi:DNA-binding response regulator [Cellulomonas xiejunii]|uniref:DNA-binding response regulator n=1 Tax=Cellulomonas xiejunii TaxID=2968083 RepID=UPI0032AEA8B4
MLRLASYDPPAAVIARRAHLAPGTVRNYLLAAQTKLGAATRAEAAATAERSGGCSGARQGPPVPRRPDG